MFSWTIKGDAPEMDLRIVHADGLESSRYLMTVVTRVGCP